MEPIRIFSNSDSKLPLLLLYEDLSRLVVPGLPNADDSAVRLDLVDIGTGNPDLLRRVDRSRHDGRSNDRRGHNSGRDNRCCDDARADNRICQDATNNPTNETRPEMPPSASPGAMMMVMVHRGRCRTMVHHRRRPPAEAATMTAKAAARTTVMPCEQRSCRQNRAKCKYEFLVHVCLSFLRFCGHVKIGHELNKN